MSAIGRRVALSLFALAALGCGRGGDSPATDSDASAAVEDPIETPTEAEFAEELGIDLEAMQQRPSGLYYVDLEEGRGLAAQPGHVVVVEFTGWLPNGVQFDSSDERGQPEEFPLGARRVIIGKEQAVEGMRIGGVRKVVVPPELAFGARGRGNIPPNATLIYEIKLIEIKM
jgi:FKBP-type peptidyl-prolyl cis-trans isomerase